MTSSVWLLLVLSIPLTMHSLMELTEAYGICYGMMGNNLPPASDVVAFYKKLNVTSMRLFDPNTAALQALKGSGINVALGVLNADIPQIASSMDGANQWFTTNVAPYINDVSISYITVGNEVIPGQFAAQVLPAMQNLQNILKRKSLQRIKVSTVVATVVLGTSYPPSAGAFSNDAIAFLSVRDGNLGYQNLFDAIVDAFFSAMEKVGISNVDIVVSESGWPSDGNGVFTTPNLAATYNKNFITHISQGGTPKRPNTRIEGYIFALFNENLKPPGVEQNFGLFYPNFTAVYQI
ncbi:unnamed protein product [Thlaspi arvense]|uniref:glucan endo-1,3-beta-D-glucosidase n=1 Tax=Thlaspi arvense TaxID=13288 RepID=A0AAU9RG16_THLAR|nr:unnamed protein product [Thlaspi arvense]